MFFFLFIFRLKIFMNNGIFLETLPDLKDLKKANKSTLNELQVNLRWHGANWLTGLEGF